MNLGGFLSCCRSSKAWFALSLFLFLSAPVSFGQGSKLSSQFEPVNERDQDHPRQRDEWFMRGRSAPGQSSALLRYRAHQQKLQMRAQQAVPFAARGQARVPAAGSSSVWTPLGPAPLASDASGVGVQDYNWVSGRATSVAVDPADSTGNTVFVGGAFGGVWKSSNAGPLSNSPSQVTWTPVIDDLGSLAVGAIAIQPGNSNPANSLILVGTGEPNSSADSYYGLGVFRSTNAGASWSLIQSANSGARPFAGLGFSKIAFSTSNPSLVVAAAAAATQGIIEGLEVPNTVNRGLYYSTDAGLTWSYASIKDSGTTIAPGSATAVVYNATAGAFFAAMRYHGIYSSTDGINWTRLANQPGPGITTSVCPATPSSSNCPIYRGEFAVVPGRNEMYAWIVYLNSSGAETDGGVWKTTNGGSSPWTQLNEGGITTCGDGSGCGVQQGVYNLELSAVPNGSATDLYAGAINLYKCTITSGFPTCNGTTDGPNAFKNLTHVYGCSAIAKVHPDQHSLAFAYPLPSGKNLMYFANDGGIYRSLDGFTGLTTDTCGQTNQFDSLDQTLGSMTQFVSFSIHPSDPNTLLGGTQDNGSPATSQAMSNTTWSNVNAGDGGYNAITPSSPLDWFVSNPDIPPGGLEIDHCSSGINCTTQAFASDPVVTSSGIGGDDGDFYFPYILDPQSDHELLVGTCRVWRGPSLGGTYTVLSSNFEVGGSATCTGSETNLVRSLAAGGPKDTNGFSNVIYAGTNGLGPIDTPSAPVPGGHVWVTTNAAGGVSTFTDQTGSINPSNYPVSGVAIDTSDATGKTAYVTIMGFGVSHVWKTTTAGASWTDFTGNLPDAPANAVVVDPAANGSPATVYVGTDVGVFSSATSSASWTEVGPAPGSGSGFLPNVPVTALRLFNITGTKKLRASTYGRGIWEFPLVVTPDYQINVTNSPLMILPNQAATFNANLTAQDGYSSAVTLSCGSGTVPPGCAPSPTSVTPTASGAPFTVGTSTIGSISDYTFNIHGVGTDSLTVTHDQSVTLHVVDFALTPLSPASISANEPNSSAPVSLSVTAQGAFTASVSLSCSGLPAGAACSFVPQGATQPVTSVNPTAASPVQLQLTITTSPSTPVGPFSVTVTGSALGGTSSQSLALTITNLPDFTIAISNSPQTATATQPATFNGVLTAYNGYTSAVNLTCGSGAPPTCTLTPASLTPGTSGTPFTAKVQSSTAATYNFTVVGTGTDAATMTHAASAVFNSVFGFTLPATSGSQTVKAGASATYTLAFTPEGGNFPNAVTYTCAGLPALSSCAFTPAQINAGAGATNVTLTIATTAPTASLYHRTTFYALWLPLPGMAFVFAGMLGRQPRRKRLASYAGLAIFLFLLVLLAACGGSGSSTTPPPQPGTPAGNYTVTITANSGALTQQTTVSLTVQ
jgi:large repetitive protein